MEKYLITRCREVDGSISILRVPSQTDGIMKSLD